MFISFISCSRLIESFKSTRASDPHGPPFVLLPDANDMLCNEFSMKMLVYVENCLLRLDD